VSVWGLLGLLAIAVVALLHIGFFILESFLWTKPVGRRVFGLSQEVANGSKALAVNQGLYNLFLAAGLIWGLCFARECSFEIKMFFLICVLIAGIVGGITAKRSILIVQALPAAIALLFVLFSQR
jgi:putative membrane protein